MFHSQISSFSLLLMVATVFRLQSTAMEPLCICGSTRNEHWLEEEHVAWCIRMNSCKRNQHRTPNPHSSFRKLPENSCPVHAMSCLRVRLVP
eukprot:COSAG02_NODE_68_length_42582_cov_52.351129_23_plen_92_part_00